MTDDRRWINRHSKNSTAIWLVERKVGKIGISGKVKEKVRKIGISGMPAIHVACLKNILVAGNAAGWGEK